ncbi:MAG: hypothetical protein JRK53_18960 [Deltaproteobacteria bacterium]|nr:hypothetical protein [Deltaproteobacteria bacterium]
MPKSPTTMDPFASFCANFAYDAYTVNTVKKGELPFWNPYQGLGQPLLSNGFSALFYPPNWLRLVLPPAWWDMVYLVNWFLAALFLYLYLRFMGVGKGPALVGAAAIFSNGYFAGLLALREVVAVSAWWPLLLYGVERAIREPSWRFKHVLLALGVYCTTTGGQPEVAFFSLFTVLAYALIRLQIGPRPKWRGFMALVPGSLAGLLLSTPAWFNFAAYVFTQFTAHTSESGYGLLHTPFAYIATYVFPYLYGLLLTHPYGWIDDWIYDLSPGWFPAIGLFASLASLKLLKERPRWALGFLLAVAVIMTAKIWGVPVVGWLGRLPLFDRIFFSKFGGFLPATALSGLTAYGVIALARLEAGRWKPWVAAWWVLATAIFVMSVFPLMDRLGKPLIYPEARETFVIFSSLGFAWVVLGPLGLWWFKYRRPEAAGMFYLLAAAGMILQGVAYACNGYDRLSYAALGAMCLGLYVLLVCLGGAFKGIGANLWTVAATWALVTAVPVMMVKNNTLGPPVRHNPLTTAPYLDRLAVLQQDNRYRSYSLDGTPQPNFAAPFSISSLNIVEAAAPSGSNEFMRKRLDRACTALWFGGNHSAGRADFGVTATQEMFRHLRYFELAAVRYLVTLGGDPNAISYERFGPWKAAPLVEPLEATFPCPVEMLNRIQVKFGTYNRTNPGVVTLTLLGPEGNRLGESRIEGESIRNNKFMDFDFPDVTGVKGKELRLRVAFRPSAPGSMIAAWHTTDIWGERYVFGVVDPDRPFRMVYEDQDGIRIWENRRANARVFLAPEAKVVSSPEEAMASLQTIEDLTRRVLVEEGGEMTTRLPPDAAPGRLIDFRLGPNDVRIRYEAYTSGILTLMDSYMPGWGVKINGREAPVLRVNGAFRGVRIEKAGTYHVHYRFRPVYWPHTLAMAGMGLAILIWASMLGLRKLPSRRDPD